MVFERDKKNTRLPGKYIHLLHVLGAKISTTVSRKKWKQSQSNYTRNSKSIDACINPCDISLIMQRASETTPLVETRSVPVVIKPYVYNFKDDMALDSRGIYSRNSFWFLNLGLLSCYLVCGLIIAALSEYSCVIADMFQS